MNRSFSIYLDIVRFSAAFLVYLWHANQRFLSEAIVPASKYGHSSVVVFFVLSGFVISYITDTKENSLSSYSASRISRVFSVAVPAVLLTVMLDAMGRQLYPDIYAGYPFDKFIVRIVASILMATEVWSVSITSFSNVPYWSIGYEWWYYVTFAMVMFLPKRIGLVAAGLTFLILGPKIILLAPIWWMGVLLYRWHAFERLTPRVALFLVATSFVGIVLFHSLSVSDRVFDSLKLWIGAERYETLTFSRWFLADYLLGALVFMNFASMRTLLKTYGAWLLRVEKPVRFLAAYTFTLYLLHEPLFLFWGAVVHGNPSRPWYFVSVTILMLLSVGLVGHVTENRRGGLKSLIVAWLPHTEPGRLWSGHPVRGRSPVSE